MHLAIQVVFYIIETVPIFVIARKSGHEYAWLAFVPIAFLWLLCDMADLDWYFIIIWLVPLVNIIFLGVVWWRVAENTNKQGWLGLLMVIPIVNLVAGYYIAFADTGMVIG